MTADVQGLLSEEQRRSRRQAIGVIGDAFNSGNYAPKEQEALGKALGVFKELDRLENAYEMGTTAKTTLEAQYKTLQAQGYETSGLFAKVNASVLAATFQKKEQLQALGINNADLGVLYRLIPLLGYKSNIIVNPMTKIPFVSNKDIAYFLGDRVATISTSMNRLIRAGVIDRVEKIYIANADHIVYGRLTVRQFQHREQVLSNYRKTTPAPIHKGPPHE